MAWHLPSGKVNHWRYPGVSARAIVAVVCITSVFAFAATAIRDFVKEVDPRNGHYSIHSALDRSSDRPIAESQFWQLWLQIEGDEVVISENWSCGVRRHTFLSGHGSWERNRIVVTARTNRSSDKSGELKREPDGNLIFYVRNDQGNLIELKFKRVSNASTMFDNLGWH